MMIAGCLLLRDSLDILRHALAGGSVNASEYWHLIVRIFRVVAFGSSVEVRLLRRCRVEEGGKWL